jgi:hypothetical protein
VKATQLLHAGSLLGGGEEGRLFNIEGGLQAWHAEVDSSFPKY